MANTTIGKIIAVSGNATVKDVSGVLLMAQPGMEISSGSELLTSAQGQIQFQLNSGQTLALGENQEIALGDILAFDFSNSNTTYNLAQLGDLSLISPPPAAGEAVQSNGGHVAQFSDNLDLRGDVTSGYDTAGFDRGNDVSFDNLPPATTAQTQNIDSTINESPQVLAVNEASSQPHEQEEVSIETPTISGSFETAYGSEIGMLANLMVDFKVDTNFDDLSHSFTIELDGHADIIDPMGWTVDGNTATLTVSTDDLLNNHSNADGKYESDLHINNFDAQTGMGQIQGPLITEPSMTNMPEASVNLIDSGQLKNGATALESGAVSFDGNNDEINVNNSSTINLDYHETRSISLWFNANDIDASGKQVLYEEGGTARGLNIYLEGGQLLVGGWNTPNSESGWDGTWINSGDISSNDWHHVVLTLNGDSTVQEGSLKAYLDGALVGEGAGSALYSHSGDITLGRSGGTLFEDGSKGSGHGFEGEIKDANLYNIELTPDNISELYAPTSSMPIAQMSLQSQNAQLVSEQASTNISLIDNTPEGISEGLVADFGIDFSNYSSLEDDASQGSQNDVATLKNGAGMSGLDSVHFDGDNDVMQINNSSDINLGTHQAITISLRFSADDVDASGKQVLYEQGGTVRGLNMYIENGELFVGGWNEAESGWQGTWLSTDGISSNEMHHVVLTLDGSDTVTPDSFKAYLDGELFGSGDGSQLWSHSGDVNVGASGDTKFHDTGDSSSGTHAFAGEISDINIYDTALDASDVNNLYTSNNTDFMLEGTENSDSLMGQDGDDILIGHLGNDTLEGNAGADTFLLSGEHINSLSAETDAIVDFKLGQNDSLSLTDLLEGVKDPSDANEISDYLSFSTDGDDTTLEIDINKDGNVDHTVEFKDTNLFEDAGVANNASSDLVTQMLDQAQIVVQTQTNVDTGG